MAVDGRWAGRSPAKDQLRTRIWTSLQASGFGIGPLFSSIPNFVGADLAAWRLAQTSVWKAARNVKVNPDQSQYPLRLRALYEGKVLFCPVPELTKQQPYVRIDPALLTAEGITFELAATHEGYMRHGQRIDFEDIPALDLCVFGSVAVTRSGARTGKGGGFADLETGILNALGKTSPSTAMATTVHSSQLVPDTDVVMMGYDCWLDFVATEAELIETGNKHPRPSGIHWDSVQPDQYETIPFLRQLRDRQAG